MKYLFGVDYYPEHWPRERWAIDARMMREMGIQIVRMGEFSWAKWEPREGEFHFEMLDEVIEILAQEGIDCILGTPSAAPPAWIIEQNPDIQPIDAQGLVRHFGGRHHDCQSNPAYRSHILRFVAAYAEHFAANPHVVGWQVDNELGNSHGDLCFCENCGKAFRVWLEAKYKNIDELNRCWGTAFWSQQYDSFSQIHAPKQTASGQNPSQLLDWKRFCSDLVCDFHQMQAEILRKASPDKFITHNMMGFSEKVNYYDLGKQLDFAAHDQYPGGHFRERLDLPIAADMAAELDMIRSVKQRPFWIMEQQSGITGWETMGRAPRPGQLALWATQSIAHGADAILFFRWRSCLMGTEQYWHGILPHNGIPGRCYHELRAFIQNTAPVLEQIQGTMPQNEVGILFSYDQEYAIDIQPHHPKMRYLSQVMSYYRALYSCNIGVDFLSAEAEFSKYRVIIAPLQYLMTEALADKLKHYVKHGGTLVLTMRAGIKDENNLCFDHGALPHMLSELCGVEVEEYDCLREMDGFVLWDEKEYGCEYWCDILRLTTAEPLAVYAREFYAGTPAITRNSYGSGDVYYVGTQMQDALAQRFVKELISHDKVTKTITAPEGVEIVSREGKEKRWFFVLNHTDRVQPFSAPDAWKLCLGESGQELAPFAARCYMVENTETPTLKI